VSTLELQPTLDTPTLARLQRRRRTRRRLRRLPLNLVALLVFVVWSFPVYWMITTALKPGPDIIRDIPKLFPSPSTLVHFRTAIEKPLFWTAVRNSVFVSVGSVLLATAVAFFAATAVARFRFRGRKFHIIVLLIVQMIPFEALVIPLFIMARQTDMIDKLPALVFAYLAFVLPFTIWMLRGFIAAIPVELEEAAMVDGCSRMQAFRKILLPLVAPGLVATSIFAFIQAWNEFIFALTLMPAEAKQTLPIWLTSFSTRFGTDWGGLMAASSLFTLPVVVFFLAVRKHVARGMTAGAVKG
jgi:N,N'-diacetylchitobiose transport system permease protein